jgi:C4-dicarboxylate-specific signal transduction histidine kinase
LARQQVLVRTELSPDLPTIVADRGGLEQVLVNLILNAVDAMTGASEPKVLTVASRAEGSAVRVEVRDRGKGCDPEQLRRMFEPFYSTKDDGLGMGLAISRSIVEAHAGQLWAAPNDDAGLTLQFTLTAPAGNGA